MAHQPSGSADTTLLVDAPRTWCSPHAVFEHCPQCGGDMAPEHAHFRCRGCGWRDSCCD